jgi:hypothetical protein
MYNDLILMVHKLVALCSTRQQINIMLSHGIVYAIAVTGQLSSIDGVTDAIDVQVAKNKRDLKQEIVIFSQLHVINVQ